MEQFFTKLKRGMIFLLSWIAAILLVAMSFLVIYQVFTRYVLNSPSDFTEEIVRYHGRGLWILHQTAHGPASAP